MLMSHYSEVKWKDFKEAVMLVATDTVGLKHSTLPRKPWITGEMINTSVRIGKKEPVSSVSERRRREATASRMERRRREEFHCS